MSLAGAGPTTSSIPLSPDGRDPTVKSLPQSESLPRYNEWALSTGQCRARSGVVGMTSDGAQRGDHVRQHPHRLDRYRLRAHRRRPPPCGHHRDRLDRPDRTTPLRPRPGSRPPAAPPVAALRDLLSRAHAVVLCTPEYAGALLGAFKNALDRTVGSDKPVAWIKVAADARRGEGAHGELATVPGYVQARVPEACTHVSLDRNAVDADGLIADETTVGAITGAIAAVLAAFDAAHTQPGKRSSSGP